jgi:hypothetical protein
MTPALSQIQAIAFTASKDDADQLVANIIQTDLDAPTRNDRVSGDSTG